MTMHVVLGDGEMSRKELTETLKDLWEKVGADESFWFVVQGKSEPSETDQNLVKWLHMNEVYYEVLTDDKEAMSDIYTEAQETYETKRLAPKVLSLLNTKPEDGESAVLLALFVSDDPAAEEDRWLNTVLREAAEAGFKSYALNDGLVEVEIAGAEAEPETEPEEKEEKKPAKKAALRAVPAPKKYTREALEDLDLAALKDIAATLGIELPPRTRMNTYIDHILGTSQPAPAAEVEEQPLVAAVDPDEFGSDYDGEINVDVMADAVVALVLKKLVAILEDANR